MIRKLYDWCLGAASKPYAAWVLALIAFAESSFFPIPPDLMLIPMALARRDRAFYYAGLCTVASVIGGLLGYFIGAVLYDSVGAWLIHLYGYGDKVEAFRDSYARWGALIILLKGLTPIPYKLVTITSGFAGYSLPLFVLFSAITRAGRFFLVAGLIYKFGPQAKEIIEKRLEVWTFIFLGVVVVGVVAAVYLF
ncbi:MAG TPA: YqaA family protein [Xanthobacteraceae bacterium]|jgi:membrane protein YqaA with SNARE-associated domain|nr:YqaA family protein [Xanthobacteraceae bacterium]